MTIWERGNRSLKEFNIPDPLNKGKTIKVVYMGENNKPDFSVSTPIKSKDDKTFWQIIGSAWKKENGDISVKLNALPLGDSLYLAKPKKD